MIPIMVFPDVELLVVDYLRGELELRNEDYAQDATLGTRKPSPMPAGAVIQIRRVGGLQNTEVSEAARIDVLVWHDDEKQAMDLTQLARALLHQMRGTTTPTVYRVEDFAGPARFADPDSDQPRCLLTVEVTVRGDELEPSGS